MAPKMARRIRCRPNSTTSATVQLNATMTSMIWPAVALAFLGSSWPMYWLVTTAPPVARADMIWIIRVLKVSTRLTPETAASPTEDTIRVSARPMVTLRACSATSGSSRATSCCRVKMGRDCAVCVIGVASSPLLLYTTAYYSTKPDPMQYRARQKCARPRGFSREGLFTPGGGYDTIRAKQQEGRAPCKRPCRRAGGGGRSQRR